MNIFAFFRPKKKSIDQSDNKDLKKQDVPPDTNSLEFIRWKHTRKDEGVREYHDCYPRGRRSIH